MGSMDTEVTEGRAMSAFDAEVGETARWFASSRFDGITRLHSARQVVEQRGTISTDYTVARVAAGEFYDRLRELFGERRPITTFGPYSPGQAVAMKRIGIEGIYLGGWATSAKGSVTEDPGPDLASYPLSQVPDEAAPIVRALLTADRNQRFARSRMTEAQRADTAGNRLPAVHHRRCRYRARRRRARQEPDPALRRGRRPRLPHRGPEARHQEVRAPGRQGARRRGRADQAAQRGPLPARHHERARPDRGQDRRRGGHLPRRPRGRAGSSVHPRRHQHRPAYVQGRVPGHDAAAQRARRRGRARSSAVQDLGRGVRRGRRLARADGRAGIARSERSRVHAGRRPDRGPAGERGDALSGRLAGRGEPAELSAGGRGRDRLQGQRGRVLRPDREPSGWPSPARPRSTPPGPGPGRWASTSPGIARSRRLPRATTRCKAGSSTRSPGRWRWRRLPTSCGWRPRPPIWPTRSASPRPSTPNSPASCSPTTSRRRSTGTRPG